MSDDQKPEEISATPPDPTTPAGSPTPQAESPVSVAQTPGPKTQTPSAGGPRAPIDYAMPAHKSYLPSPALIKNLGCLIKMLFGLTVLLGLGYFALMAMNPKARQWATQGAKDGSGGPTPFKAINQILAIPAQAVGKTDDVVQANNARVGQLDGLIAEEEKKTKGGKSGRTFAPVTDPFASPAAPVNQRGPAATGGTAPAETAESQAISRAALLALAEKRAAMITADPSAAPAKLPEAKASPPKTLATGGDAPEEMKLPGDIVITQASPAGSPRASAAFFYWIVKLNVSGITQSKPARLLLNNRLAYEGDEVNRPLGIVFAQLDPANQLLIFKDATGAIVTRSY